MSKVTLEEARTHLAELIEHLAPGDEILITQKDHVVAKPAVAGQPGSRDSPATARVC